MDCEEFNSYECPDETSRKIAPEFSEFYDDKSCCPGKLCREKQRFTFVIPTKMLDRKAAQKKGYVSIIVRSYPDDPICRVETFYFKEKFLKKHSQVFNDMLTNKSALHNDSKNEMTYFEIEFDPEIFALAMAIADDPTSFLMISDKFTKEIIETVSIKHLLQCCDKYKLTTTSNVLDMIFATPGEIITDLDLVLLLEANEMFKTIKKNASHIIRSTHLKPMYRFRGTRKKIDLNCFGKTTLRILLEAALE